jgi:phosphoribosylaminoimidazole-succinocarboxamide synthase
MCQANIQYSSFQWNIASHFEIKSYIEFRKSLQTSKDNLVLPYDWHTLSFNPSSSPAEKMAEVLTSTDLSHYFKLLSRGKVRDLYEVNDETILFVATDRVSAFDVVSQSRVINMNITKIIYQVLENGIPDKGALLTQLTSYWFSVLCEQIPSLRTHFISLNLPSKLIGSRYTNDLYGRSMQVRKLKVFPIESIVRGYITGSAWSEYKKHGTVHGMQLPEGLKESQKLDPPLWTPSTKAEIGEKDENISTEKGQYV